MSGPTAQILVAMITLFNQHGFYARVVSINNVLLHSTRGCRTELFKIINGDVFFPLKEWPLALRLCFWTKPLSDAESFKMMLFLIGNGLVPRLAA